MRILWFANTPCSAIDKLGTDIHSGGWLKSLEEELHKEQDLILAICFYSTVYSKNFEYNGTKYFPIFKRGRKSKISRLLNRLFVSNDGDFSDIKKLIEVIDKFKPTLIHVHGTEDNFGLVQYFTKIPIVISYQGILNSISDKFFSGIPSRIAEKNESILKRMALTSVRHNFKRLRDHALREKKILANAEYIIGRTDFDRHITNILAPKGKYYTGNEILRSGFYLNTWNKYQFSKEIVIVTTSGDGLFKGFESVVNIARILKEIDNFKFKWKVIGLSEKSNVVKIVKSWKGNDFDSINIQLLNHQNEETLINILLESDIYCQTSHIENSPNSLCEAMILGMPIIASFAGGTSSLIKDREEGILIQDGDSYSFAGAIFELVSNFVIAKKYGEAARIRALKRHNKESIKKEYLEIYQDISAKI